MKALKSILVIWALLTLACVDLYGQYFGRNKPRYQEFNFEVYETPHFRIHEYLENDEVLDRFAEDLEKWYLMHQQIFQDTFNVKNPFILYNNHPEFQQTNAIGGAIGVSTGGITEGMKNRVVMPMAFSNQQTEHVAGHELVHAFQFRKIIGGDSTSLRSLGNLPLWMVEGLAEYMSIGSYDPHTAMWMRDAVISKDIPELKKLNNPKYFPYRYGQAFWAFLTGVYGDDIIEPFFMATAQYGIEVSVEKILNMNLESLSNMWVSSITTQYGAFVKEEKNKTGRKVISKDNAGKINISPSLSPNGRYVIFLSEKDLFSTDLFLAEARNGKIIGKIGSSTRGTHIDDYSLIESSGTWSPDSKKFAFVAVSRGNNILVIKDIETGKTLQEEKPRGLPAFSTPTWSPDGKTIVVSGLVNGQNDLYQINLKTGRVKQLTNDYYSELQPSWSSDGSRLVFATDRLSFEKGRNHGKLTMNLAEMDMESGDIKNLDVFFGADNLNPMYDHNGNIVFLSDRDGYRNLYRYETHNNNVYKLTDLSTGISGITKYAPAITVSHKKDRVLYTHYTEGSYNIHQADSEDFIQEKVPLDSLNMDAGMLGVVGVERVDIVNSNLEKWEELKPVVKEDFVRNEYKPGFKLDYIGGSTGIGVGTSSNFGTTTGLAGGINMIFSDVLGNNQIYTGLAMNGEIYDFGGAVTYLNKKNKIGYGVSISHIPYRTGYADPFLRPDTLLIEEGSIPTLRSDLFLQRIFEDRVGAFAQYPFSTKLRAELGAAYSRYYYRTDQYSNYYDPTFGSLIAREKTKVDSPEGFNLWNLNAALVGDNSYFGLTAPMKGSRYRLGVEQYFGKWNFVSTLADYRQYIYKKPVTFAVRGLYFGRYGKSGDLPNIYVGDVTLVRGYGVRNIEQFEETMSLFIDQAVGSKVFVANFEVRLPFTGPERLAIIPSKFFFTDLNFFVDGGIAFNKFNDFDDYAQDNYFGPVPIMSTGLSLRLNLLGALVLEPFYAWRFAPDPSNDWKITFHSPGQFGLNIYPGW